MILLALRFLRVLVLSFLMPAAFATNASAAEALNTVKLEALLKARTLNSCLQSMAAKAEAVDSGRFEIFRYNIKSPGQSVLARVAQREMEAVFIETCLVGDLTDLLDSRPQELCRAAEGDALVTCYTEIAEALVSKKAISSALMTPLLGNGMGRILKNKGPTGSRTAAAMQATRLVLAYIELLPKARNVSDLRYQTNDRDAVKYVSIRDQELQMMGTQLVRELIASVEKMIQKDPSGELNKLYGPKVLALKQKWHEDPLFKEKNERVSRESAQLTQKIVSQRSPAELEILYQSALGAFNQRKFGKCAELSEFILEEAPGHRYKNTQEMLKLSQVGLKKSTDLQR